MRGVGVLVAFLKRRMGKGGYRVDGMRGCCGGRWEDPS